MSEYPNLPHVGQMAALPLAPLNEELMRVLSEADGPQAQSAAARRLIASYILTDVALGVDTDCCRAYGKELAAWLDSAAKAALAPPPGHNAGSPVEEAGLPGLFTGPQWDTYDPEAEEIERDIWLDAHVAPRLGRGRGAEEPFVPPAHYRRDDDVDCCVHAIPVGPDSCPACRELADEEDR